MKLDKETLGHIKIIVQNKLNTVKGVHSVMSDSERDLLDGKELAYDDVVDIITELIDNN